MKKLFYTLVILSLLLVTCKNTPTEPTFDGTFPDPNFEAAIRASLNLPDGEITQAHLDTLTYLYGYNRYNEGTEIVDITGIEYCTNLERINLSYNNISDISLLRNCTKLTKINFNHNKLENLLGLEECTELSDLEISINDSLSNLSPLSNCTKLKRLRAYGCNIKDISDIAKLHIT